MDQEPREQNQSPDASADEKRQNRTALLKQGAKYLTVGVASAAVELLFFSLFYYVLGLSVGFASPASLVLSTVLNFLLSSSWSFKGSTNMKRSALLYTILFVFNTCFSSMASTWIVGMGAPALLAKLITMACIVLWNFVLYRKVIFI